MSVRRGRITATASAGATASGGTVSKTSTVRKENYRIPEKVVKDIKEGREPEPGSVSPVRVTPPSTTQIKTPTKTKTSSTSTDVTKKTEEVKKLTTTSELIGQTTRLGVSYS